MEQNNASNSYITNKYMDFERVGLQWNFGSRYHKITNKGNPIKNMELSAIGFRGELTNRHIEGPNFPWCTGAGVRHVKYC